jgi:hypothetical protein
MKKQYFTVNIEATIEANSENEARNYLIRLALRDKNISSAGMTDKDLNI